MLKLLRIQHLILIEEAEIPFEKGLNVLSGETGSGKSAVMEALSLIIGERADSNVIRKGHEKGSAEAIFEIDSISSLKDLLREGGINCEDEELIIRREISASGKSRAFINNQAAQLSFLKKVGEQLIKSIGQHANQLFLNLDNHRYVLDNYGELQSDVDLFAKSLKNEYVLQQRLDELKNSESQRLREIERCHMELEDIQSANLKEGEEEEVYQEYSRLSHSDEILQKTGIILEALTGEKNSVMSLLNKVRQPFEKLPQLDVSLTETLQAFKEAAISLQEVGYSLQNYQSRIDIPPDRAEFLNERLTCINKLKKKYGNSLEEILVYAQKLKERLHSLENADEEIEKLEAELEQAKKLCHQYAQELTKKRTKAAKEFEKQLTQQLRALNMPKVEFHVKLTPQKRTMSGDERIEFFMTPNIGEHLIPIKDCASGGELSRLLLAIQTVMAGKEMIPIMLFDEIDSNIGGETATIVGEKLAEISAAHQVICVTHFPQVASRAHHHLQIAKKEVEGRTLSQITILKAKDRERELSRMVGGTKG